MPKLIDLTGKRFGRLTVVERGQTTSNTMWRCKCDCGNETIVAYGNLKSGRTKSCGCLYNERHGKSHTRLYSIWVGMKTRCNNPNHHEWSNYGGRGIAICDEWQNDFISFYNWAMYNGYADNLTLDRKDNNKGYSPENCRWSTNKEQQNNRRSNHTITYNGKTQTIKQWADELGIPRITLQNRITRLHWDIEKAMTTKDGRKKGSH